MIYIRIYNDKPCINIWEAEQKLAEIGEKDE